MVSAYDLTVAALSVLVSLGTVMVCLRRRAFLRYFFLNVYLLFSAAFTVGCVYLVATEGYDSVAYFYFYYVGDSFCNIFGFLLIASLFDYMFRNSAFRPYVRPTLSLFFLGVVGVSLLVILRSVDRFSAPGFLVEFQQNMFFVGVLLTFLLWASMAYLRAESRRFVLLASGLGIYFSAHAANYAVQFLSNSKVVAAALTNVPPVAYTLMVALWLYTFLRVPEGAPAVAPAPAAPREEAVPVRISSG
ncbi:MAG TPA: hypothetical protein VLB32_02810 [Candidatus Acidoferrales bacterium]|nr:hypothetical protein [Candidatus Acidoferrales bacterium]